MVPSLAALLLGYLLGSVPFAVVWARVFGLGDLREIGSGNPGASNVLRTGNRKAAGLTLLFDALKGTLAVTIGWRLGGETGAAVAAFGAFIGHCFPVWLGFRGGKGVATYLGALLGLKWPLFLLFCAVWLGIAYWKRMSSLSALTASAVVAAVSLFTGQAMAVTLSITLMTALLFWRHRENIDRLRKGTESRISFGSKR